MATTPSQYLNNTPAIDNGNLSPLQLAAAYYMMQGQQNPFFINHEFARQLKVFADTGIVTPQKLGLQGLSIVAVDDDLYLYRKALDCGEDENRYEQIYIGKRSTFAANSWSFGSILVRGGSIANGAGGPWGTGGLTSQDPTPNNSLNRSPDIVSNTSATYGTTSANSTNGIG